VRLGEPLTRMVQALLAVAPRLRARCRDRGRRSRRYFSRSSTFRVASSERRKEQQGAVPNVRKLLQHWSVASYLHELPMSDVDWLALWAEFAQATDNKQLEVAERIVYLDGRWDFTELSGSKLIATARQIIRERVEERS
jgi:hypothetical protein